MEHEEIAKVYLDNSIGNGSMAWTWHIAPNKSMSTLKSSMMPDLTPEFSVDGLNWHRNLTNCLPQVETSFEIYYSKDEEKGAINKIGAFKQRTTSN